MISTPLPTDALFKLEREIAQRADELTREHSMDREHALDSWRQAEREVWDREVEIHSLSDPDIALTPAGEDQPQTIVGELGRSGA